MAASPKKVIKRRRELKKIDKAMKIWYNYIVVIFTIKFDIT